MRGKKPLGTFPLGTGISLMTSLDTTSSLLATRYTGDTRHDCTYSQETAAVYDNCLLLANCSLALDARLSALIRAGAVIGGGGPIRAALAGDLAQLITDLLTTTNSQSQRAKLGLNLGVYSLAHPDVLS